MAQLWRLRLERMTRSVGRFYGTRATAYGDVQSGPRHGDAGRTLLAFALLAAVVAATLLGLSTVGHDVPRTVRPLPEVQRRTVIVCVQRGESMRALVAVLHRRGLVADPPYFYWYWYLRPAAVHGGTRVPPGPHILHTGMTPDALAQALAQSPTTTPQAQAACRARGRPPR
jgi:cell division protein YceG involved in septum cleavage